MATTNLNIRIDSELKRQSEEIFNELGLTMSAALTVFLRQTVRTRGIPFEVRLGAPDETSGGKQSISKPFHSVRELKEDLDADD